MQQDNMDSDLKSQLVLRYLRQATGDDKNIPWHIATQLFDTGLFPVKENDDPEFKRIVSALEKYNDQLSNQKSPLLIFNVEQKKDFKFDYIELTDMLAWSSLSASKIVSQYIQKSISIAVSSKPLHNLCGEYIDVVNSNNLKKILYTAAKVDKALFENWDWQISILKQACDENYNHLVKRQMPRLLRVTFDDKGLLQDLQDRFNYVIKTLTDTTNKLDINYQTIDKLIDQELPCIGHLPWNSDIGLGSTVSDAVNSSININNIWSKLEPWMNYDHPAWWYYIWVISIKNPELVPQDAWSSIWHKIGALLGFQFEGYEQEAKCAERYLKLSEFYAYRIEASLTTLDSDFILWAASKLASDIVLATKGYSNAELDNFINHALDDSKLVWQISSPAYPATSLRAAFVEYQSYWPYAIQASINEWDIEDIKEYIPSEVLVALGELIRNLSLRMSMCCDEEEANTSGLINHNLIEIRDEWRKLITDKKTAEFIDTHKYLSNKYLSTESVQNRVSLPIIEEDVEGIVALSRFHSLIRYGAISTEQVFNLITQDDWKYNVEPTIPSQFIYHIIDGILTSVWNGRESLRVELPHWAAQQCLNYLDNKERRNCYFISTIFLSMKSNTSSAITRLMFEDKKNKLQEDIDYIRKVLTRTLNISPAWVSGRIRSVLSSICLN